MGVDILESQVWCHTPAIPALGRLRQEDDHKFKVNSSLARVTQKKKKKKVRYAYYAGKQPL